MELGHARRVLHLRGRGPEVPIGDVVPDGVVEEDAVLLVRIGHVTPILASHWSLTCGTTEMLRLTLARSRLLMF